MKTTISAKIIADSISPAGARLTTFQLVYPRFIHGELMTHRVFSRNAMSSRAVPAAKMIEQARNDPVIPMYWGKNQPGMQAREELHGDVLASVQRVWQEAAMDAARSAEIMTRYGLHKQVVNRLLEPFQWMHTVLTATEWDNFFKLRCHPDAEPHLQQLAELMRTAISQSTPVDRDHHLPYVDNEICGDMPLSARMKLSAARCARVSYKNHDGTPASVEKDLALADTLMTSGHLSPFEHAADATNWLKQFYANFRGWRSFRNLLES